MTEACASVVGVTAGASAPELLGQGLIDRLLQSFAVTVEEVDAARETETFKLPRVLVSSRSKSARRPASKVCFRPRHGS